MQTAAVATGQVAVDPPTITRTRHPRTARLRWLERLHIAPLSEACLTPIGQIGIDVRERNLHHQSQEGSRGCGDGPKTLPYLPGTGS